MTPQLNDCWNRIGVGGDGSCVELATSIHCRNCGVYSAAAAQLLDREPTDEQLDEATDEAARARGEVSVDSASVIVFRLGGEWFALSPLAFEEITDLRPIRRLPHRGGAVLGLVNVRGELVTCLSLARVMGLADAGAPQPDGRLVVLGHPEGRLAFPVDEVRSIHTYATHELKALPATVPHNTAGLADGVLALPGRTVGRLDGRRLAEVLHRSLG